MSWKTTVALSLGGVGAWLGILEWITLRDDIPDNHLTAAFRQLSATDLGDLILGLVILIVGIVIGHIKNKWSLKKKEDQ